MEHIFDFPPVLGKYSGQLNIGKLLHHFLFFTAVLVVFDFLPPCMCLCASLVTHNGSLNVPPSHFYLFFTFVSWASELSPSLLISVVSPLLSQCGWQLVMQHNP